MATLYFKVSSDYEEVIRLRQECEKLEAQLLKMDKRKSPGAVASMETQLASTRQQMMGLVTEAAKAGAVMENDFKKKIYDASQSVNGFTEQIIAQKNVVKNVEADVKRLSEAYRNALKNNPIGAQGKLSEYNAVRRVLEEERAALFGLTQQQAEARLSVKRLRDEYSLYKKEAGETMETNNGLSVSWGKMLGVIGGITALKQLGSDIVRVRGEFQSMQTDIETMVGKNMAGVLIPQIKELAKVSPLTLSDMVNAEKMMLGFNIRAEDTIRYLQALSDISMGDGVKFKSLTLAFSQMSAAGKLMGQDLNQMINAGFNPLQIIAEKTGKSIATLKDEMSKGAVSAEMVQQAFIDATSAGGKFYQMSENASKTINGQLSMMQDALDAAFNEIGQASEGVIMKGIQLTTTLIQNYETVGKALVGLVAVYGTYRTAVMLATVATSKHTIAEVALTNVRVLARKAQMALNAAMLTNPYVALATVITGLVATMWALSDSTTAAEKAQERFSQKSSEMKNKEEERKKSLESLISTINDETAATVARADALNKLKSEYPDIFRKYVDEKGHITDLIELWKEYNDQASVSSRESKQRMVEYIDTQIAVTQNNLNTAKANSDWGSVKKYREQLESLQEERAKWVKEVLADVNRELSVKEETPKTYAEDYEQARKDWEEAKKELAKIEAEKDKFTSEQYEKAKKRVETTEKAYKNLGGDTKGKGEKSESSILAQQSRISELEQKQAQARIRQQADMENQAAQARIDAMSEGAKKERAQRELDNRMELQAIERQKQDYIQSVIQSQKEIFDAQEELKAKQNPSYKKQSFYSSSVSVDTAMFDTIYDFTRKRQINDRIREQERTWNEYLQKYGTYQQKRRAIIEKYDKEISEANTAGDMAIKTEEKKAALESLDEQYSKTTRAMADLFEDASEKSVSSIQKVIDKYELLVKYLSGTKQSDNTSVTKDDLKGIGFTDKDIEKVEKGEISIKDLTDALKGLKEELKGKSPWQSFVSDMQKGLDKLKAAKRDSDKIGEGITNIGDAVTGFAPSLGEFADNIASIFGVEDSDITEIANALGGLGQTAAGVGQIMSGDIVGGIMSGIGGISSIVSAFTAIHDKKNEKQIQRLQDQIDALDLSFGKLERSIEDAYSKDASALIEDQNELLEQQKVLIQQQIREEEDKKKTDDERIKEWKQQIEDINDVIEDNKEKTIDAIFGEDVQSAIENFVTAYADAWTSGENRATAAKETVKQMMRQMVTESIKAAIQSSNKMEEIRTKLQEFYADNVLTQWEQDYIYDMARQLQERLDRQFGWADSLFEDDATQEQQAASSRGFGTEMTHEDTGELSGRFTAVAESNYRIEAAITQLSGPIGAIAASTTGLYNIAEETRSILAASYLELQEINENTGNSAKYLKDIKADIAAVKENTSRI